MRWLWGPTGYAFFDVWSLVHFSFWFFVGSVLWSLKADRPEAVGACLFVAFAWEAFERVAERRWPAYWLNPESFLNAWVSDPLTCVAGLLCVWYALDHGRVP